MPKHTERGRRGRRRASSQLDWFSEDPWAEPSWDAAEQDDEDTWYPGLWEPDDEDKLSEDLEGYLAAEPYDDWGPIRRRAR